MFKKLTHNTVAAAAFAALLLVGACASHRNVADTNTDTIQNVTQSSSVAPAPGPALVDKDGNIYSTSAAGGVGNHSSVGTNTNVNIVPDKSTVAVTEITTSNSALVTPTETTTTVTEVTTTPTVTTTTTTVPAAPMTSSVREDTQTTSTTTTATTTETTPRKRMRKD
jgi:hypothetical protein